MNLTVTVYTHCARHTRASNQNGGRGTIGPAVLKTPSVDIVAMHIIPNTDLLIAARVARAAPRPPSILINQRQPTGPLCALWPLACAHPPWALAGAAALTDYLY